MHFVRKQAIDSEYDDQQVLITENVQNSGHGFLRDDDSNLDDELSFVPAALPELPYSTPMPIRNDETDDVDLLIANAPTDRYRFTFFVFYLLGTATMTPWNFFVTSEEYWMFKFRNTTLNETMSDSNDNLTPLQKSFTCDLTLTASISGTTFLILNAIYGQRVPLRLKMLGTLIIILIIFIITTVFVQINTDLWQEQFFLITLFTVVIMNICSATMSGAVFGIAGLFPSNYITALVSGQALGGVFTALTFLAVLACGATPHTTAFVFFNIGSILILLSIICYIIMSKQPFFHHYIDNSDKISILNDTVSDERTIDVSIDLEPNLRNVFSTIYVEAVSICLIFATTLSVYPAVTVLIQSQYMGNGNAWNEIYFLPVVNYLLFNVGDYAGRVLAGFCKKPHDNPHTVLLLAVTRVLYIPFFLCANTNVHNFLPIIVKSDIAFISMMVTFAVSNGYLANITLIMAPRSVKHHEKEMASSIMVALLSCGLAIGSMLSMAFVQLL